MAPISPYAFFKVAGRDQIDRPVRPMTIWEEFKSFLPKKSEATQLSTRHAFSSEDIFTRVDKKIASIIYEPHKPALARSMGSFSKHNKIDTHELDQLMSQEKEKSGTIFCEITFTTNNETGILFITSKGVAFGTVNENTNVGALAGASSAGVLGAIVGHAIHGLRTKNKYSGALNAILQCARKYAVSLAVRCSDTGVFIPFENINEMVADPKQGHVSIFFGDQYVKLMLVDEWGINQVIATFEGLEESFQSPLTLQ